LKKRSYQNIKIPKIHCGGFWFLGLKELWFFKVKAHSIMGAGEKAKDPIFGLTMGAGSQATGDLFR